MLRKNLLRIVIPLYALILSLWLAAMPAAAQEQSEIILRMSRDFGYSSGTGKIQGTFSMRVTGPENLSRVAFYIDEQSIGEATQSPFKLRFNTDSYSQGAHTLYAVGYTSAGHELRSNEIRVEFVSAEQGWQEAMRFVGPLLILVFGVMCLSFIFTFLNIGKLKNLPLGTPRKYGLGGGAICPKCARPFGLNLFAPNMVTGKLAHCPFCGKWGILRPKSMAELRAAEAAELEASQRAGQTLEASEEEKLRKELDESRFQDL